MERIRRSWIVFLLALFLGTSGFSQNKLQGEDVNQALEEAARDEAERWTLELAMSAKQTTLMEDVLIEYALKENTILQSKMREEVKTRMLLDLELAENKSMRDILTKPQYDRYLTLLRKEVRKEAIRDSLDRETQGS